MMTARCTRDIPRLTSSFDGSEDGRVDSHIRGLLFFVQKVVAKERLSFAVPVPYA
jgi:hypothetical protein